MLARSLVLPGAALAALALTAACASPPTSAEPAAREAQAPAPMRSQATAVSDLPPLPPGVNYAARRPEVVRALYEFTGRHPEVMRYIPCFCGCERGGHMDNHDCFVAERDSEGRVKAWDTHAIGCEICLDVAQDAMQMYNGGASVAVIRDAIEKKYASPVRGHTPTPMPPKGGRGGAQ